MEHHSPEIPTGLMSRMAHSTRAMDGFFSLDDSRRDALVQYIQGAQTGEEAKSRMEEAVEALEQADSPFGRR